MVPLDLADRLRRRRCARPGADDSLHVTGFDPGPIADNLVLRAIAAHARGGSARVRAARSRGPAGGPAGEADPDRRRAGRRVVRCGGRRSTRRSRRGAWTWTSRRRVAARGRARLGRAVLPGRRSGAGRGPWRAADTAALAAGRGRRGDRAGAAAGHPGRGHRHAGRRSTLWDAGPDLGRRRRPARLGAPRRRAALRASGRRPAGPGVGARRRQRPGAGRGGRSSPAWCRSSARCCGCWRGPSGCPARVPRTGRSILHGTRRRRPPICVLAAHAAGDLPAPGGGAPFVAATRILGGEVTARRTG